jgi:hypothetical protein
VPTPLPLQLEQLKLLLPRSSFRFSLQRGGLLLLPSGAPTGEGNDNHRKEQQHERNTETPKCGAEVRMAARLAMIDAVSQDSKHAEVRGDHGQTQYPGNECGQDCKEGSDHAGADRHNPGDESHAAGNGVQDHCSGQAIRSPGFNVGEVGAIGCGDGVGGCVADVAAGAPVWRVSEGILAQCSS